MMMSLPTLSPYLDLSAACMCSVRLVHVHVRACMLHTNKYVLVFGRQLPLAVWALKSCTVMLTGKMSTRRKHRAFMK